MPGADRERAWAEEQPGAAPPRGDRQGAQCRYDKEKFSMNSSDFSRQLGGKLRIARLNCGLSLAQVEERSGGRWTKDSLGAYESGRRRIKAETFAELAGFYGVCHDALLPSTNMPLPY
jgi:hypothetical protein